MASAETQKPSCPVCHQSDQVKTTQAAYDSGVERCAPPDMPTRNVSMLKYILISGVIVGIFILLIFVLIGSEAQLNTYVQLTLVGLALISIVAALVTSYIAFQRVVKGDAEATERFPAWDRAVKAWSKLYYCGRDDVVFDPEVNKVVSDQALGALRSMQEGQAEKVATTIVKQ